ncbi:OTU domain-containing protein [Artemisia annua]|uniref:Ubiquitin thioesterase OTU n=1 Tax=Artemisia annua TaxID=35608 RepID=A0A2U1KZI8_ARTAN|nr:OTU domain-containing protein [Artemisia annua]
MLGDVLSEQRPKQHWSHSYGHIRRHAYDTTGLPIKLVNNIPNHRCISYKNGLNNNHHVGEGSWNVAWDVRPARWIHRPHNVWFIFGGPLVEVVDELMKRRKETEWFIEGDFDAYVKRIQQTFVWGGEPELLMASHVLKTTISVYMFEKDSNNLSKIATYGEEYEQSENSSIKVLFHGYGHYDILEGIS